MMVALSLFFANLIFIFLKAFQQKNVTGNKFGLVVPTSFGMAIFEYFIIGSIAVATVNSHGVLAHLTNVFAIGAGAGLGAVFAMILHNGLYSEGGIREEFRRHWGCLRERFVH